MIELAKYADMKICVAVSGGKDSMALLHFLHAHGGEYGITLSALNCDHKIRGEASQRDSKFVKEWCMERNIPIACFEWNATCTKSEGAARLWRIKCYLSASSGHTEYMGIKPVAVYSSGKWEGADAIATAHHLNDNAETVLFNLARGSALSGMEGITDYELPAEGCKKLKIIHPLISVSREEIDEYIRQNEIPFVEDESNFTDDYTRNKIRHNVLPELEKAVPGTAKAIYRFSRLAADDEEYFDNLIKERKLIKETRLGCEIAFCREKVVFKRALIKTLVGLNIKDYTSEHAGRLYELQFAENGKRYEFLGFTAFKENGKIVICNSKLLKAGKDGIPFKEHCAHELMFFDGVFIYVSDSEDVQTSLLALEAASETDERLPKKFKVLKFDIDAICDTAQIRFMREGDKFTKFGGGTKALGDYFTDKKIPQRLRGRIPLIADGGKILAVGGVEISDKIKITAQTKKIYYLICEDFSAYI